MDTPSRILASLRSQDLPLPSVGWLAALANARDPPPSIQSLVATARARLLASDLTTPGLLDSSYASTHSLPGGVATVAAAVAAKETSLPSDVITQVLDIEDISHSRWEQIEELEAIERGEHQRGRQLIRLPVGNDQGIDGDEVDAGDPESEPPGHENGVGVQQSAVNSNRGAGNGRAGTGVGGNASTHKLVLQDCRGQNVYALELKRIGRMGVKAIQIGEKILLRKGAIVARGVVLLEPSNCMLLGGKIDSWHRPWVDGRLARLKIAVQAER